MGVGGGFTDLGVTYLAGEINTLPDPVTGYFSETLPTPTAPATAIYRIRLIDGTEAWIYLTSGPATDLATLLTLAGSPIAQSALQTVIDAHELDLVSSCLSWRICGDCSCGWDIGIAH